MGEKKKVLMAQKPRRGTKNNNPQEGNQPSQVVVASFSDRSGQVFVAALCRDSAKKILAYEKGIKWNADFRNKCCNFADEII